MGRTHDPWSAERGPKSEPRLFGRTLQELHDQIWARSGVRVVRCGANADVVAPPALPRRAAFLLLDGRQCVLIDPRPLLRTRKRGQLIELTVRERNAVAYREQVSNDPATGACRIERHYRPTVRSQTTIGLTRSRRIAEAWRHQGSLAAARHAARIEARPLAHRIRSTEGLVLDRAPMSEFLRLLDAARAVRLDLVGVRTGRTAAGHGTLIHESAQVHPRARLQPPVAIGAGRRLDADSVVLGPLVIPDRVAVRDHRGQPARPARTLRSPLQAGALAAPPLRTRSTGFKRTMDVGLSLLGLTLAAPIFPLIILAIWLEDGRPFFFMHRRQTMGGREFACLKFRTMCRDAEDRKRQLALANQCDGPQFHLEDDPRLLRVGRWLRRFHLDELPQFLNVLLGQMDLVGPRPSPHAENQFCPTWREARLSVRPGVTGLWQVARTRQEGADFQEWIRYDLQYVERRTVWMDCSILVRTVWNIIRRGSRKSQPDLFVPAQAEATAGPIPIHYGRPTAADDRLPSEVGPHRGRRAA
jgi:lipopolysaccharide/colanic/teichoic acid biosynthesis glycosyltransferase